MQFSCIVCNEVRSKSFCVKNDKEYVSYSACRHAYLKDSINEGGISSHYANRKSHHGSELKEEWDYSAVNARLVYEPLLKQIAKFSGQGRLLDIGCSNGSFLHAARAKLERFYSWDTRTRHVLAGTHKR